MSISRAPTVTEAEWQAQIVDLARALGWDHLHIRRSRGRGGRGAGWITASNVEGWPDLLLWHERQHRVLAVELKSEKGRTTPEQEAVLASLGAAGIEVHVWRPSDLDRVQTALSTRRSATAA